MQKPSPPSLSIVLVLALLPTALILTACAESSGQREGSSGTDLAVLATTPLVGDLAEHASHGSVTVETVVEPGADPHTFDLQSGDIAKTLDADLILASGLGLDSWASDLVERSGSDADLMVLSDHLPDRALDVKGHHEDHEDHEDHGGEASESDPHWWHDPRNAASATLAIGDRLGEIDPAHEAEHRQAAKEYADRVLELDAEIAACLSRLHDGERTLVTDHQVFGHFAERYDLQIAGTVIPALTSQAQPSAKDISRIASTIERDEIAAIFTDRSADPELAQTLAEQTGARVVALNADTIGAIGTSGATYLTMLASNAAAIADGLSSGSVLCRNLETVS